MVQQISLIDKKSHQEIKPEGELGKIKFPQKNPSVIKINASPEDIKAYKQEGSDLVVTLKNGEVLRVDGFFEADHSLVLEDAVMHQLKWVEFTANGDALDATYKSLENTDSLLYDNDLMGAITMLKKTILHQYFFIQFMGQFNLSISLLKCPTWMRMDVQVVVDFAKLHSVLLKLLRNNPL
jgi:hypothetical protein